MAEITGFEALNNTTIIPNVTIREIKVISNRVSSNSELALHDYYNKTASDSRFIQKSDLPLLDEVIEGKYVDSTTFKVGEAIVVPEKNKFYVDVEASPNPIWYVWTGSQLVKSGGGGKASEVENDSSVAGANVKEALENLKPKPTASGNPFN